LAITLSSERGNEEVWDILAGKGFGNNNGNSPQVLNINKIFYLDRGEKGTQKDREKTGKATKAFPCLYYDNAPRF